MSRKIGINERVVEKTMNLQDRVIDAIVKRTKGEKPFAMEEIPPDIKMWVVDNLGTQDVQELVSEFGIESVNRLYGEVMELKNKRGTR